MKPYVVGAIFARGGSKGVPGKNLRILAGKPLIAYAIETALASKLIDRVIVSTDDAEIAAVAQQHGAEVPFMRPQELARDDSPEWLSWQHAIRTMESNMQLTETLKEINKTGISILLVEQDVMTAFELANRGFVLESGRVFLKGPTRLLADNPTVREAYMGI